MSCSVRLFAVSITRLGEVLGGNDTQVLRALVQLRATKSQEVWDLAEEMVRSRGAAASAEPHQVGYALQALCQLMGERVPSVELNEASALYLEMLAQNCEWAGKLLHSRMPMGLPAAQDFPVIGCLTCSEITSILAAWDDAQLDDIDEESASGIAALLDAMEVAKAKAVDLIAFTQ